MFIGTTNTDKIAEIAALLQPLGIPLTPISLDIPEIYDTFAENSALKATEYAKHVGGICLSEDSGLAIDALGGLPGPWSARFYSRHPMLKHMPNDVSRAQIDKLNNLLVLNEMNGIQDRQAKFIIYLTVASPDGVLYQKNTEYSGLIASAPIGDNGFGYDPIFIGHDTYGRTLAELDSVRKNMKSHRKHVLDEFYDWASNNVELLK